jgi:hypothetical protein
LIDGLRDAIWQHYNIQLIDEFRDQLKPNLVNYSEKEARRSGLLIFKKDSTKNGGPDGLRRLHHQPSAPAKRGS